MSDKAVEMDAAKKYQNRETLLRDVNDWASLTTQLTLGLGRIVDVRTKELEILRKELENRRSAVDKAKRQKKENPSLNIEGTEQLAKAAEDALKAKTDELYSIFGKSDKDYIVRDKGMKRDAERLRDTMKSVKRFYALLNKANNEAVKGERRPFFGDEVEFEEECKSIEDENDNDYGDDDEFYY